MTEKRNTPNPSPVHHWLPDTFLPVDMPEIVNPALSAARRYCAIPSCHQTHLKDGERFYNPNSRRVVPAFYCLRCATRMDELSGKDTMALDLTDEQIRAEILLERAGVGIN